MNTSKAIILIACLAFGGCASMTPTQKKVVGVLVIGTAIAMARANGHDSPEPARQFPCACTPQPRVE